MYVGGKLIGGAEKVNAQIADGSLKKTVATLRQVGREVEREGEGGERTAQQRGLRVVERRSYEETTVIGWVGR